MGQLKNAGSVLSRNSPCSISINELHLAGLKVDFQLDLRGLIIAVLDQRIVSDDISLMLCTRLVFMLELKYLERMVKLCLVNRNTKLDHVLELMLETSS